MKHINIAATLGWQNVEDLEEGLYLQPKEAAVIDGALNEMKQLELQLRTAQETIASLNEKISAAETSIDSYKDQLQTANEELKTIKEGASGKGTYIASIGTMEVSSDEKEILPRYDSAEHPANIAASRINRFKK